MMRRFPKRLGIVLASVLATMACGAVDRAFAPPTEIPSELYWDLEINHPAIRLSTQAPYDTATVIAEPYGPRGMPYVPATAADSALAQAPTFWYSTDSVRVRVTQEGVIRAYGETGTTNVYVIARRTIGTVTHADSALVQVVKVLNPPVLQSFSVRPTDSLKRAAGSALALKPLFRDVNDSALTGFPVHYQVENEKIVKGSNPWASSMLFSSALTPTLGKTLIRARTLVYGVAKMDTFTVEAGYPIISLLVPRPELRQSVSGAWEQYLFASEVHLGPGATMGFSNHTGRTFAEVEKIGAPPINGTTVSFIFDNPDSIFAAISPAQNSGGGNILDIPGDTLAAWTARNRYRRFPVPGRYEYTVQPLGLRGVVVIHDR